MIKYNKNMFSKGREEATIASRTNVSADALSDCRNNIFFPCTARDWSELSPEAVQSSALGGTFMMRVSSYPQ